LHAIILFKKKREEEKINDKQTLTAVLQKEDDLYVAECPEVGTVSQAKLLKMQLQI